jgi:hypothetical protein
MNQLEGVPNTMFGLENSSTDANKFYSIMLDARAIKVSANMCDIAEKLVMGEKENAKRALEQLWALKKNLTSGKNTTIDLLIRFYQEKIDVLRAKEEHIKKVSKDSRGLLEEKRKKDEEIASVKQQINDCARELKELKAKLDRLTIKEAELSLIESQVRKELDVNENEIVNGLYEIILAEQGHDEPAEDAPVPPQAQEMQQPQAKSDDETSMQIEGADRPAQPVPPAPVAAAQPIAADDAADADMVPVSRVLVMEEKPPFPRFIVKTTTGRVIGEYFFDGGVAKEARHYIFNTRFFARAAAQNIHMLKTKFDQAVFNELLQMIQDVYKRVTEKPHHHFEVATNEILNGNSLKQLWLEAKMRSYDEVERFCARLLAKIETMGGNYRTMLQEQMTRCLKS